jgi:hypothetical protein
MDAGAPGGVATLDESGLIPLAQLPIGAQIQSDFNQTDNTAPDFIKNKPTLGTAAAAASTDFATAAQGTRADNAVLTTSGTYVMSGVLHVPTPDLPQAPE